MKRPAGDDQRATRGMASRCNRRNARHVRREERDGDTARRVGNEFAQRLGDVRFRGGSAFPHRVRRIADHREHAFVAERLEPCGIVRTANNGRRIEFPVAGMEDGARRRSDREAIRFGDRMRNADEFDFEGAGIEAAAERHFLDRQRERAAIFADLRLQHSRREGRREDRAFERRPEIDDGADVVLVRVGQDEADEVFALGDDEAEVGQHDIGARLAFMRKGHAQIDHQPGARTRRPEAIEIDVHADLAETAERHEYEFVWSGTSRSLRWCAFAHGVPSRAI